MREIVWEGEVDDFVADVGGYLLRVEQMDPGMWWWAVIKDSKQLDRGFTETKDGAKNVAEETYTDIVNMGSTKNKVCPDCKTLHQSKENYYCNDCSKRFKKWGMPDKINENGLSKSYD